MSQSESGFLELVVNWDVSQCRDNLDTALPRLIVSFTVNQYTRHFKVQCFQGSVDLIQSHRDSMNLTQPYHGLILHSLTRTQYILQSLTKTVYISQPHKDSMFLRQPYQGSPHLVSVSVYPSEPTKAQRVHVYYTSLPILCVFYSAFPWLATIGRRKACHATHFVHTEL